MKRLGLILAFLGVIAVALVVWAPSAAATTNCNATGNWCQGWAQATAASATGSRCFSLRLTNTAPGCTTTTSNEAAWDIPGGSCINFYYFDQATGAVPPAVPNKVTIILYNDGGTLVSTIRNAGTEQANGSPYSVCAQGGGSLPRSGTYEIYLQLIKDDGPAGVGNYGVDSRGVVSGTGITIPTFDKAVLRADIIIASITRSAYPAGSTFAYGAAGDESVTITSTFTQPNAATNKFISNGVFDAATLSVGELGAPTNIGATTTLAQSFVVDTTFTNGAQVPALVIGGNTATLTGLPWTIISTTGNGATIVRDSSSRAHDSTTFNTDPRIVIDSDGSGSFATADDIALVRLTNSGGTIITKVNRGETDWVGFFISNARSELLSRAMTVAREDATPTTCNTASLTPTANLYSNTFANPTSGGCLYAASDPGSARFIRITNTDQNHRSLQSYSGSSLYYVHAHIQLSSTVAFEATFPGTETDDTAYIISNAQTDTTHLWCWVVDVRKDGPIDTSGSAVSWNYKDPLAATRLSGTTDTDATGKTPTHLDLLASTPLGTWTAACAASFNGNTGNDIATFTVSVPTGGGGFPGDPLRLLCAPLIANPSETVTCTASENNLDGSARTGNTAGTLYDLWNPSNTQIVTGGAVTEIGTTGNYRWTYAPGASPALGNYIFVVRTTDASPVSSSTVITIETDPTIALANSLATALVDTGLIKGYTDQVEGYTDTLEGGQATMQADLTTIAGYTDSLEASAATAATAHTTIISNQASNLATLLAEIEETESAQGALLNFTTGEILAQISAMNVTFTGNFTVDEGLIQNLTISLQEHRDNSLELTMTNDFSGFGFDGFAFALLWLVLLVWSLRNAKLLVAGMATVGLIGSLFTEAPLFQLFTVAGVALALWLEATVRERLYARFFQPPKNQRNPPGP